MKKNSSDFLSWAPAPPMGWNSWDCFATTVTEAQTKAQADFMADKLKTHGWQYIVVDIQWYEPDAENHAYRKNAVLTMDAFGRLLPAENRFPSAADGAGFKPLASYMHSRGLKFGVHVMRGIPKQAVEKNLPIYGTSFHAGDIADRVHVCPWNPDMYGVDMGKRGAQDYYDSVFAQFAEWDIDYVKVDDLSRPYFQNLPEIEAIRKAIDKTGRPMVLSLSPGATDIRAADHVTAHANLWRISDDFWDRWLALREQFHRLSQWNPHRLTGAWPDADMLPLGTLVLGERTTRFTEEEQVTLMTLWSIARSPLMHGGDMTKTDPFTLKLLTNDEVLAVNQKSAHNRPLFDHDGLIAWTATDPATGDTFLALFNTRDRVRLTPQNARQYTDNVSCEIATHAVIDINVRDGKKLFLIAEPATEADNFTPVVWNEPRLVMTDGSERPLTDQEWTSADAQWDSAAIKKDTAGNTIGLGAMATAVFEYALPAGAARFRATALVDAQGKPDTNARVHIFTIVGTDANEDTGPGLAIEVNLNELGELGKIGDLDDLAGHRPVHIRDLWTGEDLGEREGIFAPLVPYHGAKLYRLTKR